jgi:DNA-binding NarL/FixJ family response regulator
MYTRCEVYLLMTMHKPRVLIAEDHLIVSEGLAKLLEPECIVVGTVADGRALVQAVKDHTPDIAVIDISLPLLNGLEAARQVKKCEPWTKMIFLTMHSQSHFIREAFKAGGSGYILKQSATEELVFAIREVHQGRMYVSPSVAQGIVDLAFGSLEFTEDETEANQPKLTVRQLEILQLVAEGKTNKEIAVLLNLSVKTVEFHKSRIMQTLGLTTTPELTKYAISRGIVSI